MKYTFEDFKKESIEKFGDIFQFFDDTYVNKSTKIKIVCQHGHEFYRSPESHIRFGSCPICKKKYKTTEDFILASKAIHGDKFCYDYVEFKNFKTKIHLVCNDCGEHIYQTPTNNLLGNGCIKCAKKKPHTKESFIDLAKSKHGDLYSYEEVEYVNMHTKVKIWCNTCKKYFYQDLAHHLKYGCLTCGGREKLTQEEFIRRSLEVHGENVYDYSNVVYKNIHTKVDITCLRCGNKFKITPKHHIHRKQGCAICELNTRSERITYRRDEYINMCIEKFGDAYDYSLVPENVRLSDTVKIFCKKCNKYFTQTLLVHMKSVGGCRRCAHKEKLTQEEFLSRAFNIHGNDYDYSKTIVSGVDNKVTIICNKCKKEFLMSPYEHIAKRSGCKYCSKFKSKGEKFIQKFLIDNHIKFEPQYKIPECRNINPLPFDFAVFNDDGSINFLIEMQGKQHYYPTRFNGMTSKEQVLKNFQDLQLRDKIKKDFCENNHINILYITYKQLDKIEEILEQQFKTKI